MVRAIFIIREYACAYRRAALPFRGPLQGCGAQGFEVHLHVYAVEGRCVELREVVAYLSRGA